MRSKDASAPYSGPRRRATIGKHSETLTADMARKKAKDMRRTVEDGGDPLGVKQAQRDALTVDALGKSFSANEDFRQKLQDRILAKMTPV